jgi:hypothetical protein
MEHARPRLRPITRQNAQVSNPARTNPIRESSEPSTVAVSGPSTETYPAFAWEDYATPGTKLKYLRKVDEVNAALESVTG